MELVNAKYKTEFEILYLPLVRNTEKQFKTGLKFGIIILIILLFPFLFIKLYFGINIFEKYSAASS